MRCEMQLQLYVRQLDEVGLVLVDVMLSKLKRETEQQGILRNLNRIIGETKRQNIQTTYCIWSVNLHIQPHNVHSG